MMSVDPLTETDAFPTDDNLRVEIIGRRVFCPRDMFRWEQSEALADIVAFVERMNVASAERHGRGRTTKPGKNVSRVLDVLRQVRDWARAGRDSSWCLFSAVGLGGRFPSFGAFHEMLSENGPDLLARTYRGCGSAGDHRPAELPVYLAASFGDRDTATYGPEHELSFCMFLVALFKLGRLTFADEHHVVAVLFDKYVDVVDCLIKSYRLQPSCTKYGNWNVNQFRCVAFVWGSAQLMAGDDDGRDDGLTPAVAVTDEDAARRHRAEYVFVKCMDAVHRRAKDVAADDDENAAGAAGRDEERERRPQPPLWRHSYQLWNLTGLSRWARANGCLMAAFRRDVLARFEVVCRLEFGELLKFTRNPRPPGVSFYDCCVSARADAETERAPSASGESLLNRVIEEELFE